MAIISTFQLEDIEKVWNIIIVMKEVIIGLQCHIMMVITIMPIVLSLEVKTFR